MNCRTTTGQLIKLDNIRLMPYNIHRLEGDTMKLQEIRKRAGVTQAELADNSGVKLRTIQEYEYGRQILDTAKLAIITALADALQVPLYELIEDEQLAERVKENTKREV